jgi:zinc/manganese transport system ATP-binding protein
VNAVPDPQPDPLDPAAPRADAGGSDVVSGAGATVLRLEGVSVSFGDRLVLDEVGFSVDRGEFVGIIGANGSGKTTIFRVVLGLLAPDAGRVIRPRRHIGYVPQKVAIDPDTPIRARDLVTLGIDGERYGVRLPSAARRARVDEMLDAVGAGPFADARVGTLSGGELQRVLIAHALVGDPQLLIMDEPLANLDIKSGHEIVELVARLTHERGLAVLLSAHDMNALLPHMDRVVYLADGRAVSGTTGEVVRSDVLSELYRYPVRVLDVDGTIVVVGGHDVRVR